MAKEFVANTLVYEYPSIGEVGSEIIAAKGNPHVTILGYRTIDGSSQLAAGGKPFFLKESPEGAKALSDLQFDLGGIERMVVHTAIAERRKDELPTLKKVFSPIEGPREIPTH